MDYHLVADEFWEETVKSSVAQFCTFLQDYEPGTDPIRVPPIVEGPELSEAVYFLNRHYDPASSPGEIKYFDRVEFFESPNPSWREECHQRKIRDLQKLLDAGRVLGIIDLCELVIAKIKNLSKGVRFITNHTGHPGIFVCPERDDMLCTKDIRHNCQQYYPDELFFLLHYQEVQYRKFLPGHFGLAAAIHNGIERMNIEPGMDVICSLGLDFDTISHYADILQADGLHGKLYLSDALPHQLVSEGIERLKTQWGVQIFDIEHRVKVDAVYVELQDYSREVVDDQFLRIGGHLIIVIKVHDELEQLIKQYDYNIKQSVYLDPYADCTFIVAEKGKGDTAFAGVAECPMESVPAEMLSDVKRKREAADDTMVHKLKIARS